jgi:uncharacterized protein YecE (DUF72 family)
MKQYFTDFNIVEIQSTFYKLPKIETAERWRVGAPRDFEFTVKAWQLITHLPGSPTYRKAKIEIPKEEDRYGFLRPTKEVFKAWELTREICNILNARIVIIQCPPSFKPTSENIENMRAFFSAIERKDLNIAWEPRGEKWGNKVVAKLCDELDLIHCVDPFARDPAYTKDLVYFRLHGSPPGKGCTLTNIPAKTCKRC